MTKNVGILISVIHFINKNNNFRYFLFIDYKHINIIEKKYPIVVN
jgi:hypothetical protein